VDSDLVVTFTDGAVTRRGVLEADVEDEHWFPPPGADPAEVSAGLDVDAEEVLAEAVSDAMIELGLEWPVCPEHRQLMGSLTAG
jgi:hypothetical protein